MCAGRSWEATLACCALDGMLGRTALQPALCEAVLLAAHLRICACPQALIVVPNRP